MKIRPDDEDFLTPQQIKLGKDVLACLKKHYPAYASGWDVGINTGGIVQVRNMWLSGKMGFVLHAASLVSDLDKKVMQAGGELLERYRMLTGRNVTFEGFRSRRQIAERNNKRELIYEV